MLARALGQMREPGWLTANRARSWCRALAVVSAIGVVVYLATSRGGVDRFGKPVGTDFVSFWTAARLALAGHAEAAYDAGLHEAAQRALFPSAQPGYYAFFYPPTFLLACLPFALLPYLAALTAWLAGSFLALYGCLRAIIPQRSAVLPILAFPGLLVNAGQGQNGFITAACLGWSMVLAQRRPFLAGACMGLLVMKPHLLVGAPVALLVAGRWRMIAGAVACGLGLGAASWIILGAGAWRGFFGALPLARATLEDGLVEPWKMQSLFAAVRLLHGGLAFAYGLQGTVALAACALLAGAVLRRPGAHAEGALLTAATLLCTPFLLDYDLTCLALPIAWVAAEAVRTGWRAWEKIVVLVAYVVPIVGRPLAMTTGVCVSPFVVIALLLVVVRRAADNSVTSSPDPRRADAPRLLSGR